MSSDFFVNSSSKAQPRFVIQAKYKNKPAGGGHEDDGEPSEASRNVSTEEQGPDGDLPSADWDNLNDQTDDRHLYLSKFESYFNLNSG